MKTIHGVYTSAKIFTDIVEDYALAQIRMLCDNEAFSGSQVHSEIARRSSGKGGNHWLYRNPYRQAPSKRSWH